MELSVLRQRSLEALKQKARRGELFMTVAIGYVRIGNNRIEKDPDRRIVEAIALIFAKFAEMQSVRQVHLWFRQERIPLPAVIYGAEGRLIEWKLPVYNTILHILTNPIYAGAYAVGRTGSRVSIDAGRKKVVRGFKKERKDWEVLIPNHHEGYLSWAAYERNLGLIAGNANGKNPMSRGVPCVGVRRCSPACCGVVIADASCTLLTPAPTATQAAGIEAALAAQTVRSRASEDKRRQVELALEQARYEVGRARRQYDAVDPDNRLVAAELETRWNERLTVVRDLETDLEELTTSSATEPTPVDHERLMLLGADLQRAWTSAGVTSEATNASCAR